MDYEARTGKLETEMESVRESNARLHRAMELLQTEFVALRDHVDQGFEKQRDRIDALREEFLTKLAEQRSWTAGNFTEIRTSIERGFAESRAEAKASSRWRISTAITVLLALAGLAAKAFGIY